VEDSILNRINQKELSEKYETSVFYVRAILQGEGFIQIPKDWAKSDLPEKPDNMSKEEYLKTIEYMIKIKSGRDPEDDSKKSMDDFSEEEKLKMFEDCVIQKVDLKLLSTRYNTKEKEIRNIMKALGFHQIPHTWSKHPEFPEKSDSMSLKEYSEAISKYYQHLTDSETKMDVKNGSEFQDVEKKIVEDCLVKRYHKIKIAKTYNKSVQEIGNILKNAGFSQIPKNWSKHPNFPKKMDGMSPEEYCKTVEAYWKRK